MIEFDIFRAKLSDVGIDPGGEMEEGKLTRATCSCKPQKTGKNGNGYYTFYTDEPATLIWGCNNSECPNAAGGKLTAKGEKPQTQAEKEIIKARIEENRKAREEDRKQTEQATREKSARLWDSGCDVSADHPYIVNGGGFRPVGARQLNDMLLVPMSTNGTGEPESLQLIFPDGSKKFLSGTGSIPGSLFFIIPGDDGKPLYEAEGWKTGCSVREATGASVAVAFSSGRLPAVANALRKQFPDREIIIAGDTGNGSSKAAEAARLISCKVVFPTLSGDGSDFNDLAQESGLDEVRRQLATAGFPSRDPDSDAKPIQEQGQGTETQSCPRSKAPLFLSGNDCLDDDAVPEYVIAKTLEADSTGQMFGPSGHGKSFIKLDMLLSVATGRSWHGHNTKQGLVVNFSGEGRKGETRRIKAWIHQNGHHDLSLFVTSKRTVDFDSDMQSVVNEIRAIEERTGQPCRAIAIDTLSRHLIGDENSTKDMAAFVERVDRLRSNFPGSVVIVIHHTGNDAEKADRSRGSSALKAACDFELRINKGQIAFTKMKDGEPPPTIDFKLVPVQIGIDNEGEPVTSCIVEYGERSHTNKAMVLTHQEQQALDALITVCAANPKQISGQYVADQEEWRQEFYRLRRIEDNEAKQHTLKVAFQRVTGSTGGGGLSGKGIIAFTEKGVVPLRLADQDTIFNRSGSKRHTAHTRHIDGTCSADSILQTAHNGTHPYRGCADVPLSCADDIPTLAVTL